MSFVLDSMIPLVEKQITAFYPDAYVEESPGYNVFSPQSGFSHNFIVKEKYHPIRDYQQFEVDPMNGIINSLWLQIGQGVLYRLCCIQGSHWAKREERCQKRCFREKQGGGIGCFFSELYFGGPDKDGALGNSESERLTQGQEELIKKIEENPINYCFKAQIHALLPLLQINIRLMKL